MDGTDEVHTRVLHQERKGIGSACRPFWMVSLALFLCFSPVFFDLVRHALNESLHSHIILVPFISAYLIGQLRPTLPLPERGGLTLPLTFALLGGVAIVSFLALKASGVALSHNDYLSLNVFAFCMLLFAAAAFLLGSCFLKSIAFPAAFLLVMVPLPDFAVNALEIASQHASAQVYSWMMNLSGATYFRDERTFVLPNLTIVVAQECSGIRSSLVLFLVSLVAGHMFLRTTWKKWALAIFVFPLGIFRNAFRIYFLSMASAHWNPDIIHSPLHHRGGPIFFALSLIPFFLVLFWLRKSDSNKLPGQTAAS